ncbi:hypothetical protein MML48_2g00000338 [Holotrichia oblita]|uniref:Uncharacterized protein n=1 Tax=Holotrichia oblita TaxID=644536 RepID=A0ACB9TJH9_HOLOL|nr:hypothetical protein MML48_2g00000338 [Holotrichia oblita]
MVENKPEKTEKKKKKKIKEKEVVRAPKSTVDPLLAFQERMKEQEEEERKRLRDKLTSKIREEELKVDRLRLQIRKKCKSMVFEKPLPYQPQEPVKKSTKLTEYEANISKGTFFDDDNTRAILDNVRTSSRRIKLMNKLAAYDVDLGAGFGRH